MKKVLSILILIAAAAAAGHAQPKQLSVKEFLRLSRTDTTSYLVSGVVERIRSATSGSFYLKDDTGTLLVYGLKDPSNPGRSFGAMDIVQGDTLTVLGRFTVYGGSTLEMKDGRIIRKADGPDHSLSFYDRLAQRPVFKGKEGQAGLDAFKEWVQAHIKPQEESGTVLVHFVVGRNGAVQEVQLQRGASPALNAEALRVVKSSPKWKPAKSADGTPVRLTYHVSVAF